MAEIFTKMTNGKKNFENGFFLGKFIYLMDAHEDNEKGSEEGVLTFSFHVQWKWFLLTMRITIYFADDDGECSRALKTPLSFRMDILVTSFILVFGAGMRW